MLTRVPRLLSRVTICCQEWIYVDKSLSFYDYIRLVVIIKTNLIIIKIINKTVCNFFR